MSTGNDRRVKYSPGAWPFSCQGYPESVAKIHSGDRDNHEPPHIAITEAPVATQLSGPRQLNMQPAVRILMHSRTVQKGAHMPLVVRARRLARNDDGPVPGCFRQAG